jgi:hypothetical protein
MPLRGIDNLNGDAVYTDSTEFLDSGFLGEGGESASTSSTENNLGVYRTSSSRTQDL